MDKSQNLLPEGSANKLLSTTVQDNTSLLPSSSQHVWGRVLALGCCKIKVILRVVIVVLVVKLCLANPDTMGYPMNFPWATLPKKNCNKNNNNKKYLYSAYTFQC